MNAEIEIDPFSVDCTPKPPPVATETYTFSYMTQGKAMKVNQIQIRRDNRNRLHIHWNKEWLRIDHLPYQRVKIYLAKIICQSRKDHYLNKSNGKARNINAMPRIRFTSGVKVACEILRQLKEKGHVFRMARHTAEYYKNCPFEGTPADLEPYWSRNHVFRAICCKLLLEEPHASYVDLRNHALRIETTTNAALPRPARKLLAAKKISYRVADILANHPDINYDTFPQAFLKNANDLRLILTWNARFNIRPKHLKLIKAIKLEAIYHYDRFKNAGLPVPQRIVDMPRFIKVIEDPNSALNQAFVRLQQRRHLTQVNRQRLVYNPLPLFDIIHKTIKDRLQDQATEIEVRHLTTTNELEQEGREMHHCVGLMDPDRSFIASIRVGEERVTLMVSKAGWMDQCYSKCNATTSLSITLSSIAIPLIREALKDAPFETVEAPQQPEPAIPATWDA